MNNDISIKIYQLRVVVNETVIWSNRIGMGNVELIFEIIHFFQLAAAALDWVYAYVSMQTPHYVHDIINNLGNVSAPTRLSNISQIISIQYNIYKAIHTPRFRPHWKQAMLYRSRRPSSPKKKPQYGDSTMFTGRFK